MATFRENSNVGSVDRPDLSVAAGDDRSLLGQFQMRYPTGSLTAELLQIHQEYFLVRAAVQVAGITMASGLASADTLEVAEDRARRRALAVLGLYPSELSGSALSSLPITMNSSNPVEFTTELGHIDPTFLTPIQYAPLVDYGENLSFSDEAGDEATDNASSLSSPSSASDKLLESRPPSNFDLSAYDEPVPDEPVYDKYVPDKIEEPIAPEVPQQITPASSPSRTKRSKATSSQTDIAKPAPQPTSPPVDQEPIDLSDAIAQTTIEIKRLKWTEVQGRSYLQRTYGKRSRQHLSDEELLEFLEYLKQQPSPNEF